MICLYLYQYLLLWDASYIVGNELMSTSQRKFNRANPFSCSWDISQWSFYSYWWPDISVICCCFCTSHICADSPHLGLSSAIWFVRIGPQLVEIQAKWSLWHNFLTLELVIFLDLLLLLKNLDLSKTFLDRHVGIGSGSLAISTFLLFGSFKNLSMEGFADLDINLLATTFLKEMFWSLIEMEFLQPTL